MALRYRPYMSRVSRSSSTTRTTGHMVVALTRLSVVEPDTRVPFTGRICTDLCEMQGSTARMSNNGTDSINLAAHPVDETALRHRNRRDVGRWARGTDACAPKTPAPAAPATDRDPNHRSRSERHGAAGRSDCRLRIDDAPGNDRCRRHRRARGARRRSVSAALRARRIHHARTRADDERRTTGHHRRGAQRGVPAPGGTPADANAGA